MVGHNLFLVSNILLILLTLCSQSFEIALFLLYQESYVFFKLRNEAYGHVFIIIFLTGLRGSNSHDFFVLLLGKDK